MGVSSHTAAQVSIIGQAGCISGFALLTHLAKKEKKNSAINWVSLKEAKFFIYSEGFVVFLRCSIY